MTFDALAPVVQLTIPSKRKPWVTPQVLQLMKQRDRTYKNAHSTHCRLERFRHKALRSAVSNQLDTLKNRYMSTCLDNAQSSKAKWSRNSSLAAGEFNIALHTTLIHLIPPLPHVTPKRVRFHVHKLISQHTRTRLESPFNSNTTHLLSLNN